MKKYATLSFLFLLLLCGCSGKKTPSELFKDSASGVVVVLNEFYYEMKLSDGETLYFTGLDSDGDLENLTPNIDEIKKNRKMISGTAFFIDKEGSLVTNRHVAAPAIDKSDARKAFMQVLRAIKNLYTMQMSRLSDRYDALEAAKSDCVYYDYYGNFYTNYEKLQGINSQQERLKQEFASAQSSLDDISDNISIDDITITSVCELGVAYNNTYVTGDRDFLDRNPCVVVRTSDKTDVDLALLQLKDKKTPARTHIFTFYGDDRNKTLADRLTSFFDKDSNDGKLSIDQQLYMIGYNAGLILANTKQGIKVQMTSGKVTQLPDGQRLLYSIPALQGSSGSPVIDEYGNLVAVNFAKLNGTDNFNFGIPAERVREFINQK